MSLYQAIKRKANSRSFSVSAPVGGWNTRDSFAAMPPQDAVRLDNFIPTVGECELRKGYTEHCDPGGTNVDFLQEYNAGANRQLIAASNSNLWNVSTGTPSSIGSGFSSDQWEAVNFNGKFLLCNGADNEKTWDGSSLTNTSWTGITAGDFIGYGVFKNRVFGWKSSEQDFYYGELNAITGPMTKFPLSRVARRGGNLIAFESWTRDGGDGVDDLAVFVMSSGEVIIYQGSDPGSADNWALVGVFHIGAPIGIRCVEQVGGKLWIATRDDYVDMETVLATGQLGVASKLSGAVQLLQDEMGNFGWEATLYKGGNLLIFNHPEGAHYRQHVINTLTGGACRFLGLEARTWATFNNELYFGSTDGKVYQYEGKNDNGAAIVGDGQTAYTAFGTPQPKALKAVRCSIRGESTVSYGVDVGIDFANATQPTAELAEAPTGSLWDVALWDVALWSSGSVMNNSWLVKGGRGQDLSVRLVVNAKQDIAWLRTDYRVEIGDNL